jgi:hypothetical protein
MTLTYCQRDLCPYAEDMHYHCNQCDYIHQPLQITIQCGIESYDRGCYTKYDVYPPGVPVHLHCGVNGCNITEWHDHIDFTHRCDQCDYIYHPLPEMEQECTYVSYTFCGHEEDSCHNILEYIPNGIPVHYHCDVEGCNIMTWHKHNNDDICEICQKPLPVNMYHQHCSYCNLTDRHKHCDICNQSIHAGQTHQHCRTCGRTDKHKHCKICDYPKDPNEYHVHCIACDRTDKHKHCLKCKLSHEHRCY